VINRGDRREAIFTDDADRQRFLDCRGEACARTQWPVHAFRLMPRHFHPVLETPRANLVAGMAWLLGTWANVPRRLYCRPRVLPWVGTSQAVGLK
jgi:REP element-mobilizing transposase RayT